jgi:ABC-type dipeptide/oligopeptide/nickel transport system permease component
MLWLFFAAPLGIYAVSRYNGLPCEFFRIFSILTYSFTVYAPCVLLCFFIYTVPVLLAMSLQIFSLVRTRQDWQVKSENNQIYMGVGAGVIAT